MIPSSKSVLDLAEVYLRESLAAGWKGRHPVAEVAEQHLARGGTVSAKSTRPPRGHKVLYPDFSPAATLADHMLSSVELLDPELRKVLELRAQGFSGQEVGNRLKCSKRKAHDLVNRATTARRMFLLLR